MLSLLLFPLNTGGFEMQNLISRRTALVGLAGAAAGVAFASPAEPMQDKHQRAAQLADELAAAMAAIHGGAWEATINHNTEFVLIKPVNGDPVIGDAGAPAQSPEDAVNAAAESLAAAMAALHGGAHSVYVDHEVRLVSVTGFNNGWGGFTHRKNGKIVDGKPGKIVGWRNHHYEDGTVARMAVYEEGQKGR